MTLEDLDGPRRLASLADRLDRLHVQSIAFGYVLGVGASKGWDYTDKHCLIACVAAWISVILPKAMGSTAELWAQRRLKK